MDGDPHDEIKISPHYKHAYHRQVEACVSFTLDIRPYKMSIAYHLTGGQRSDFPKHYIRGVTHRALIEESNNNMSPVKRTFRLFLKPRGTQCGQLTPPLDSNLV